MTSSAPTSQTNHRALNICFLYTPGFTTYFSGSEKVENLGKNGGTRWVYSSNAAPKSLLRRLSSLFDNKGIIQRKKNNENKRKGNRFRGTTNPQNAYHAEKI